MGVHSGICMLLFENKWGKPLHHMVMIVAYIKQVFLIFAQNIFFLDFRVYFMQLFFMNEVRRCPDHTESECIQLLCHCRDSMES